MAAKDAVEQLRRAGEYLRDNDLVWGNAGNLSVRSSPGQLVITASGARLGSLSDEDFVECPLTGAAPEAGRRPSKELPMHAAVYAARPEIAAVLHSSPFYGTLAACSGLELPGNLFVENMYYLERVCRVPYRHPGSRALAQEVARKAESANVLLLEHHGVVFFDFSSDEALLALHALELTCRMLLQARAAGLPLNRLPAESVTDFLLNAGYRPPRNWSG